jgi:hypothetical protein
MLREVAASEKSAGETDGKVEDRPKSAGPLVFISHDTRDALLAEAFSKLLSSVSAGMLKTFRSSDRKGGQGFEYGVEWFPELMKQLESACDVVCLLTERSLGRPWILYEAGVAKGKLDIPVHGLALGVPLAKASVGPFAQFQNCDDDSDSITKLVEQLVRRLPNADPDHETVKAQVDSFKARVDELEAEQAHDPDAEEHEHDEASTAKLFEEIKVMFQDLPSRIDVVAERVREPAGLREMHPAMIHELTHMIGRGDPEPGLVALIVASLFRDDLPWLYEMGVEVYRQSVGGDRQAIRRSYRNFLNGAAFATMGPFSREFSRSKRTRMMLEELPMILRRFDFFEREPPKKRSPKATSARAVTDSAD